MKVNTVECLSQDATKDAACDATQIRLWKGIVVTAFINRPAFHRLERKSVTSCLIMD
jgi:hypothetical protein